MRRTCSEEAGYTLLELLIATILGAFLILAITETLRITGHADTDLHRFEKHSDDIEAAERIMTQIIREARPVFASRSYADRTIAFDGGRDRVQLVTRLPDAIAMDQVGVAGLSGRGYGRTGRVILSWTLGLPASRQDAPPPPLEEAAILDRVQAIRFRYFGQDNAFSPGVWHDSWTGRSMLPSLVKIEIDYMEEGRAQTAETFVATAISATPACRFDPEDIACRRVQ